jgi:plastocyanin
MRMTSLMAGLAIVLAACGGEKKASDQPAAGQAQPGAAPEQPGAPAAAAPSGAQGATHDVNMVLQGSKYEYSPNTLTVGPNDVLRFHNKSGGPHNVSFWADSIPSGAASHIVLPDPMAPLASKLAVAPDEVLEVKLNDAPKGDYKFYCTPHLALGMTGKLTVK